MIMLSPFIFGIITAFVAEFLAAFVTVLVIAIIKTIKEPREN